VFIDWIESPDRSEDNVLVRLPSLIVGVEGTGGDDWQLSVAKMIKNIKVMKKYFMP